MSQSTHSATSSTSTIEECPRNSQRQLSNALSGLKLDTKKQARSLLQEDHDELADEVSEINGMKINANHSTEVGSPLSQSSTSINNIFERFVQDQMNISTLSRRLSFPQPGLQSSTSFSLPQSQSTSPPLSASCHCSSKIPDHLTSECFIPTCLDATTEALTHDNLESLEVIQSTNANLADVLDQTYCNSQRRKSKSVPLTRRHSSVSPTMSNYQPQAAFLSSSSNSLSRRLSSVDVDYSDQKRLNFCSYADLLFDEYENDQEQEQAEPLDLIDSQLADVSNDVQMNPVSRKNSSILIIPALSLAKTSSIREESY